MKQDDHGRSDIYRALCDDELLAPFMRLPCKENGFDIEGIAALDGRILRGLRRPVISGHEIIVELIFGGRGKRISPGPKNRFRKILPTYLRTATRHGNPRLAGS